MELERCERYIHRAKVSKTLPVDEFFVAAGGARLGLTTFDSSLMRIYRELIGTMKCVVVEVIL